MNKYLLILIYSYLLILLLTIFYYLDEKYNFIYIKIFINDKIVKFFLNTIFIFLIYLMFFLYIIIDNFNNKLFIIKTISFILFFLFLNQILKILIKKITKIKRPNYLLNNKNYNNFYYFNYKYKNNIILQYIDKIILINNLYSFPSGHTILVHSLVSFIIFFINYKRNNIIFLFIIIAWSYILIYSRILYKMHSIIDIIFGILLNLILFKLIYIIYIKYLI